MCWRRNRSQEYHKGSHDSQVIIEEKTTLGELSRRLKDQLHRFEPTLGYRLKVDDKTGRSIQRILAQTRKECTVGGISA